MIACSYMAAAFLAGVMSTDQRATSATLTGTLSGTYDYDGDVSLSGTVVLSGNVTITSGGMITIAQNTSISVTGVNAGTDGPDGVACSNAEDNGTDGTQAYSLTLDASGDVVIESGVSFTSVGAVGGNGGDGRPAVCDCKSGFNMVATNGRQAGDGGNGGDFSVDSGGSVTIEGMTLTLSGGNGGVGGSAVAAEFTGNDTNTNYNGADGGAGGVGGRGGDITIAATADASIYLDVVSNGGWGQSGGAGSVDSGEGGPGGAGGRAGDVSVTAGDVIMGNLDLNLSGGLGGSGGLGADAYTNTEDCGESCIPTNDGGAGGSAGVPGRGGNLVVDAGGSVGEKVGMSVTRMMIDLVSSGGQGGFAGTSGNGGVYWTGGPRCLGGTCHVTNGQGALNGKPGGDSGNFTIEAGSSIYIGGSFSLTGGSGGDGGSGGWGTECDDGTCRESNRGDGGDGGDGGDALSSAFVFVNELDISATFAMQGGDGGDGGETGEGPLGVFDDPEGGSGGNFGLISVSNTSVTGCTTFTVISNHYLNPGSGCFATASTGTAGDDYSDPGPSGGCESSRGCYADCDSSTGVGILDIFDFVCFQDAFISSDPYACNCDRTTGAGTCDIMDFICFQSAFVSQCR